MNCKKNIIPILKDLISFNTQNSINAITYISSILKEYNFICDIKIFGQDKIPNLYGIYGTKKPNICFAGHVDVVDANIQNWLTDPFKLEIKNDIVFGRGVVDMKAALVCAICASLDIINTYQIKKNGSISFLITGDEEGKAENGTKKLLEYLQNKYLIPNLCILGEPTSEKKIGDTVKISRRGSINFHLTIYGTEFHIAYPQPSNNTLHQAILVSEKLILQNNELQTKSSYLTITNIYTNNKNNNVASGEIYIDFNVRFSTYFTENSLKEKFSSIVKKYSKNFKLTYHCNALPFTQKPNNIILDFTNKISQITGIKTHFSEKGGTSDARFLSKFFPVVEMGLLHEQAHKENEHAKLEDIEQLYEIYYQYLKSRLVKQNNN